MSTIPANPWNGAMFLVPRREGKVELWASWSLDAATGRAVRLHLAARLYLASARRHERSIQEEAPDAHPTSAASTAGLFFDIGEEA
jgi:hypothetical protein